MKASRITVLAVLFLYSVFAISAFATVNDDQVTSQKIKEADGTSGQNTNSGSGVKTGHIQDSAVTTSKMAVSAVTTSVIANGAVTDAKITGPISASKVNGLEAALAGKAEVLHNHDTLYQQKYGRVAVVALTGGDYSDPFTASNNSATWCPLAGPTNPCLLKIMPGVYDIGPNVIVLQDYMDMEGSGENTTIIKGSGVPSPGYATLNVGQVVQAMGVSEVRFLTVENYGLGSSGNITGIANVNNLWHVTVKMSPASGAHSATAIYQVVPNNVAVKFRDIKVELDSGSNPSVGMAGISLSANGLGGSRAELNNVNISSSNRATGISDCGVASLKIKNSDIAIIGDLAYGLQVNDGCGYSTWPSTITVTDSALSAPGQYGTGIYTGNSTLTVDHSSVIGSYNSILSCANSFAANSKIIGPMSTGGCQGAQIKCIGNYDSNYDPVTCPAQ